jgi:hypothetical protein
MFLPPAGKGISMSAIVPGFTRTVKAKGGIKNGKVNLVPPWLLDRYVAACKLLQKPPVKTRPSSHG